MAEIDSQGNIIGMDPLRILIFTDDDDPNYVQCYAFEENDEKIFLFIHRNDSGNEIYRIPMSHEELVSLPEKGFDKASDFQETIYPEITDNFRKYGVYNMDDVELAKAYHSFVMGGRTSSIYTFGHSVYKTFDTSEELLEYLNGLDLIQESRYTEFIPTFEGALVAHAKRELMLAGMIEENPSETDDKISAQYNNMVSKSVIELIDKFSKQGHSGFSAGMTTQLFDLLAQYKTITPITNNPFEWQDTAEVISGESGVMWQNLRDPSYFSDDGGQTWWNVNDDKKEEILERVISILTPYMSLNEIVDEHGEKTAAGVFVISTKTKQILLGKRSAEDAEAGTWGLITFNLNKQINNNEHAKIESERLFSDETGYMGELTLNEVYVNQSNGFTFYNYVGLVGDEFMPQPNWEIEKYQWFSWNELFEANPKKLHYGVKLLKDNVMEELKKYLV